MSTNPVPAAAATTVPQNAVTAQQPSWLSEAVELWWVRIPAQLRRYSVLLWAAWSDGVYLTAWPRLSLVLPLAVLAFGLFEGMTHWSLLTIGDMTLTRGGGPVVAFAQILPLLVIAVFVGSLSGNLGLSLVIGYALGDFVWSGPQDNYAGYWRIVSKFPSSAVLFHLRLPQVISYALFLLLAIWPIVSSKFLVASADRLFRESGVLRTTMMAMVQALFVYEWTFFAPMSFRTLWTQMVPDWGGAITVRYFHQVTTPYLVSTAIVAVIARSCLTVVAEKKDSAIIARLGAIARQTLEVPTRTPLWLRAILGAGLMTLLVYGFLNVPSVAFTFFAATAAVFLLRTYVGPRLDLWRRWTVHVTRYSALMRFAVATVGAYFMSRLILSLPGQAAGQNGIVGQFYAEVVGIFAGLLLIAILLPDGVLSAQRRRSNHSVRVRIPALNVATQIALVAVIVLLATKRVFAVCREPSCCFNGDNGMAGAATAAATPTAGGLVGSASSAGEGSANAGGTSGAGSESGPFGWIKRTAEGAYNYLRDLLFNRGADTVPGLDVPAQLVSEEGAHAEQGLYQWDQDTYAKQALAAGDTDEYYRRRDLSPADFVKEVTGKQSSK